MPATPPLPSGPLLLCLLLLSLARTALSAPAAVAVASGGDVVTIDALGAIAPLAPSKYSPGPACAYHASSETFFSLQRSSPSPFQSTSAPPPAAAAHAHLIGINISTGATVSSNPMPFDVSNASAFAGWRS